MVLKTPKDKVRFDVVFNLQTHTYILSVAYSTTNNRTHIFMIVQCAVYTHAHILMLTYPNSHTYTHPHTYVLLIIEGLTSKILL